MEAVGASVLADPSLWGGQEAFQATGALRNLTPEHGTVKIVPINIPDGFTSGWVIARDPDLGTTASQSKIELKYRKDRSSLLTPNAGFVAVRAAKLAGMQLQHAADQLHYGKENLGVRAEKHAIEGYRIKDRLYIPLQISVELTKFLRIPLLKHQQWQAAVNLAIERKKAPPTYLDFMKRQPAGQDTALQHYWAIGTVSFDFGSNLINANSEKVTVSMTLYPGNHDAERTGRNVEVKIHVSSPGHRYFSDHFEESFSVNFFVKGSGGAARIPSEDTKAERSVKHRFESDLPVNKEPKHHAKEKDHLSNKDFPRERVSNHRPVGFSVKDTDIPPDGYRMNDDAQKDYFFEIVHRITEKPPFENKKERTEADRTRLVEAEASLKTLFEMSGLKGFNEGSALRYLRSLCMKHFGFKTPTNTNLLNALQIMRDELRASNRKMEADEPNWNTLYSKHISDKLSSEIREKAPPEEEEPKPKQKAKPRPKRRPRPVRESSSTESQALIESLEREEERRTDYDPGRFLAGSTQWAKALCVQIANDGAMTPSLEAYRAQYSYLATAQKDRLLRLLLAQSGISTIEQLNGYDNIKEIIQANLPAMRALAGDPIFLLPPS